MGKWALLLFDHDGYTTICEVRKLKGLNGSKNFNVVSKADQVECTYGKDTFLAEVLDTADTKNALNEFERCWLTTHRAIAVQKEKDYRESTTPTVYGGYLKIWPSEASEPEGPIILAENSNIATTENCETDLVQDERPSKVRRLIPKVKEGTNGRKITVLYEGSADMSGKVAVPNRNPFFTEELTLDQQEILATQVEDVDHYARFVQTDDVLIFSTTDELLNCVNSSTNTPVSNPDVPDYTSADEETQTTQVTMTDSSTSTQPSILYSQPKVQTREMSSQTTESSQNLERKLDEILRVQTMMLQILQNKQSIENISDFLSISSTIPDLLNTSEENQPSITQFTVKVPSVSSPVDVNVDTVSSQSRTSFPSTMEAVMEKPLTVPDSQQPSREESAVSTNETTVPSVPLFQIQPVTENQPNQPAATSSHSPNPENLLEPRESSPVQAVSRNSQRPWRKSKTINHCFSGSLLEVEGPADLHGAHKDTEVRVKPEQLRITKADSVSIRNFGWNLVKKLFLPDEIVGRNFWGNKGKSPLSPRRRHAIEHAVVDMYGPENLQTCVTGVNTGIRNYRLDK